MIAFFYDSWIIILEFLIPGIFLGIVYDIFRLLRIARNDHSFKVIQAIKTRFFPNLSVLVKKVDITENWIVFMEDIVFFLIVAATEILATYHINNGEIRIYCLVISVIGFFAYQKTFGKIIIFFSTKILYLIRKTIYATACVLLIPLFFILKQIRNFLYMLYPKRKDETKND